ncbi:MAG: ABC transporter substrate-binding protein, partial [Alphaproteobacteria bacterium]|nr:ABC transporter substrate-binding protein [Alphaproteobacteria bacterium]
MPKFISSTLGLVGLFLGCLLMSHASMALADPIKIGATRTAILFWLAEELGYFDEAGVQIDARLYDSGTQTALDIKKGQIDLATSSEFAFVSNAFERGDLRVLASLSASQTTDFVARGDRGISELTDLAGKRIALTKRGIGQYFLGRQLILNGLELSDVDVVDLPPTAIVDAIAQGKVDA